MADRWYVDTNVLLRLLLADHATQSPASRSLFREGRTTDRELSILPTTVSEVVYVLGGSRLSFARDEIAAAVEAIIDLPARLDGRDALVEALDIYRSSNDDWDDCIFAGQARIHSGGRIVSFDRALDRIPGIIRLEP